MVTGRQASPGGCDEFQRANNWLGGAVGEGQGRGLFTGISVMPGSGLEPLTQAQCGGMVLVHIHLSSYVPGGHGFSIL